MVFARDKFFSYFFVNSVPNFHCDTVSPLSLGSFSPPLWPAQPTSSSGMYPTSARRSRSSGTSSFTACSRDSCRWVLLVHPSSFHSKRLYIYWYFISIYNVDTILVFPFILRCFILTGVSVCSVTLLQCDVLSGNTRALHRNDDVHQQGSAGTGLRNSLQSVHVSSLSVCIDTYTA